MCSCALEQTRPGPFSFPTAPPIFCSVGVLSVSVGEREKGGEAIKSRLQAPTHRPTRLFFLAGRRRRRRRRLTFQVSCLPPPPSSPLGGNGDGSGGGGRAQLPRWDGGGGGGGGAFCSSAAARGPRAGMTFAKYQKNSFLFFGKSQWYCTPFP